MLHHRDLVVQQERVGGSGRIETCRRDPPLRSTSAAPRSTSHSRLRESGTPRRPGTPLRRNERRLRRRSTARPTTAYRDKASTVAIRPGEPPSCTTMGGSPASFSRPISARSETGLEPVAGRVQIGSRVGDHPDPPISRSSRLVTPLRRVPGQVRRDLGAGEARQGPISVSITWLSSTSFEGEAASGLAHARVSRRRTSG